jgi:hypothetical protein
VADAAGPPDNAAWSRRMRGVGSALRHPALLLTAGALISSYLIPSFTRQWQDHQRELELKSELASQITESTTSIILAAHIVHIDRSPSEDQRAQQTWREWRIRHAVTGSRLRAYFPNSSLAADWNGFGQELNAFYTINSVVGVSDDPDETMRDGLSCLHASLLATRPVVDAHPDDATRRATLTRPARIHCPFVLPIKQAVRRYRLNFESDLYRIELDLYERGNELVDRVLHSHVKSF